MPFWPALAALYALFAAIAWMTPPAGEDWAQLLWARNVSGSVIAAIALHSRSTGALVERVLVLARPVHVLLSPLVLVALLVGMAAHALGRWPGARRPGDAFVVLAAGASLWLAAPGFGVMISHRPFLATYVYGLTAMLWWLALVRFAPARPRGGALAAVGALVLGLLAGASTRPVGTVGLGALALLLAARRRRGAAMPAWMATGALGVAVGLGSVWLGQPYADFRRLWITKIDGNLGMLYDHVGHSGQIVSVLAVLLLVLVVRARFGGTSIAVPGDAQLEALRWTLTAWAALALIGLVGPLQNLPTELAPAVVMSIAVLAVLATLRESADAWLRRGLWLLLLLPLVEILAVGVPSWWDQRAQYDARVHTLAAAAPGSVPTVPPSSPVAGDFWVPPESLWDAAMREDVARTLFGLADIRFTRPFRELEPSAWLRFDAPGLPHDLRLARLVFRKSGRGELHVTSVDWPERRGRPVLAARAAEIRTAHHGGPIANGRYWVRPDAPLAAGAETYLVNEGVAVPPERTGERLVIAPPRVGWYVLVVCDTVECWAVDAFYVRP